MTIATLLIPTLTGIPNLHDLLHGWGPWVLVGIAAMVFIESGLLFPFLPGDSLLFTAGMLHLALNLDMSLLIGVVLGAAVLGSAAGYLLGDRYGRGLFTEDARVLKTKYLAQAEGFFHRYGGRSIVLARFVPVVRTFLPVVAGAVRHPWKHFMGWNVLGAALWSAVLILAGVWLGDVTWIANNIEVISVGIVAVSLIPVGVALWRNAQAGRAV